LIDNRTEYFNKRRKTDKLDTNLILSLIDENKTRKEIAEICKTSIHVIKRFLKRHNIRIAKYEIKKYKEELIDHKDDIIEIYEKCRRLEIVAEKFNCSPDALRNFFRSIEYNYKTNNYIDLNDHLEMITKYYYIDSKNLTEISKIFNCSSIKIREFLLKLGYNLRTKREVLIERNKSEEFQRKIISSSGKNKDYTLPSGTIIKLRGYEPNFLDFIFNNKLLDETDIIYKPERIIYNYNNKEHYYYPDFFIPKLNLIVETKSSWILQKQGEDKTIQKEKAVITKGYNFLLIMDNNFDKLRDYIQAEPIL
jgi:transposase